MKQAHVLAQLVRWLVGVMESQWQNLFKKFSRDSKSRLIWNRWTMYVQN